MLRTLLLTQCEVFYHWANPPPHPLPQEKDS